MMESMEGCLGNDSVYVLFIDPSEPTDIKIYLPNAFSPDGDGLNDVFQAKTSFQNIGSFTMSVYNRWGELVFESSDISLGWDGMHEGKACPMGTYVYSLEYGTKEAFTNRKTGVVVLLK